MGGWLLAIPSFERHEKYRKFLAKLFFLFFFITAYYGDEKFVEI